MEFLYILKGVLLNLMHLNLKSKLLILATATLVVILALSIGRIIYDIDTKRGIELTKLHIAEAGAISRVIHFMQIERGIAVGIVGGDAVEVNKTALSAARKNLDKSIEDAKSRYFQNSKDTRMFAILQQIKSHREKMNILDMSAPEVKYFYTKHIEAMHNFAKTLPVMIDDRENRNFIQAYIYLSSAKEALGQTRAILNNVFTTNHFSNEFYISLIENVKAYTSCIESFKITAPEEIQNFYNDKYKGDSVEKTFEMIEVALKNRDSTNFNIEPSYWFEKSTNAIDILKRVDDTLFDMVSRSINKKLDYIFYKMVAIASLLLLISIVLAFLMTFIIKEILFSTHSLKKENTLSKKQLEDSIALLEQYKLAVDRSFIVSKTNPKGIITYVNDEFCKISGYTKEELIGKPHKIVRHPDMPKEAFVDMWHTIKELKQPWFAEVKNRNKNKTSYWAQTVINPILDKNSNILEFIAIRVNITNIREALTRDTLTGYYNRVKLNEDIKILQNLSLAIFNIDNFRQINDFYGHEFGDLVIVSIANKIYNYISNDDNLRFYKLNGDEFVVLSTAYTQAHCISKVNNFLKVLKESMTIENEEISISCSAGVSFEDKEHLLSTANMALKVAKKNNADFLVYNDSISLNDEYKNNLIWTKKLSYAIKNSNIITYYQPIVNNSNQAYEKYECLVRLKDSDKIISPFFFLDIAKQTRQYFDITKTVVHQSFEMFKDKDAEFSINLSIKDMLEPQIFEYIVSMLSRYKIGSRVVFEIVESELIENFNHVVNFISEVKKYGCKIAIDDFGTGYSNFEYLIKLQANYLKIDGSLIKHIDKDENSRIVVSTIVEFSKKLGMKTIAEFVENEEIFKIVKELGIDYSQGYYFSAPKEDL